MRFLKALLLLLIPQLAASDTQMWKSYTHKNKWVSFTQVSTGDLSLHAAVESVPEARWIKHFRIFPREENELLQRELNLFLANNYPELYTAALASAGNMHNPKVIALRAAFIEAILNTSLVVDINSALSKRCERITSVSYEKLSIYKKENSAKFYAMVWLGTDKCSNSNSQNQ